MFNFTPVFRFFPLERFFLKNHMMFPFAALQHLEFDAGNVEPLLTKDEMAGEDQTFLQLEKNSERDTTDQLSGLRGANCANCETWRIAICV